MIWLYDDFDDDYTYNGIPLNSAYDANINRVLNGTYKLTFKLPITDDDIFSLVKENMVVKADEATRTNSFRIKYLDINDNDRSVTVTAYQVFYDFSRKLLNNFTVVDVTCMTALSSWYSAFLTEQNNLTYYSDVFEKSSYSTVKDEKDDSLKESFEILKGVSTAFGTDIDMENFQVNLLKRLGRDTEEVLTTTKNISEFVDETNANEIYTRIYATATFKPDVDKEELKQGYKAQRDALRASQNAYSKSIAEEKKRAKIQAEIDSKYSKELSKNIKRVRRTKQIKSYEQIAQEVSAKYERQARNAASRKIESERLAAQRKKEMEDLKARQKEEYQSLTEEITLSITVDSPLIEDYPFINEIALSNNDCRTVEELQNWAMEQFTINNIDKPKKSIKVGYEQLKENVHIGDTVIVKNLKHNFDERIRIVETNYDPMNKLYTSYILGEKTTTLGTEISDSVLTGSSDVFSKFFSKVKTDIDLQVEQESRNFNRLFDKKKKEFEDDFLEFEEQLKSKNEENAQNLKTEIEESLTESLSQHISSISENFQISLSHTRNELTGSINYIDGRVMSLGHHIDSQIETMDSKFSDITRKFDSSGKLLELKAFEGTFNRTNKEVTETLRELTSYKNDDGVRQNNILSLAERKTAELITREFNNIGDTYVSKSFLTETVKGVERKFEEMKIGGRNLFLNTKDFSGTWHNGINKGWVTESNKYKGFTVKKKTGLWEGLSQPIYAEKGEVYTLSGFLKTDKDNDGVMWYLRHGSVKPWANSEVNYKAVPTSTEWKWVYVTFKITESGYMVPRFERYNDGELYVCGLKLEKGTIATDWSPAPEDGEITFESKLAEYRQSVDGQVAIIKGIVDNGLRRVVMLSDDLNGIRRSVSSLNDDTLKKSEFNITDEGIDLGVGQLINGNRLASLISVKPDAISLLTDKMVITSANMNLVKYECRNKIFERNEYISIDYTGQEREFIVSGHLTTLLNADIGLSIDAKLHHPDGTATWSANTGKIKAVGEFSVSVKATASKPIIKLTFFLNGAHSGNQIYIENLSIIPKTKAIVIENGSITGDQLKFNSVTTSHIQTGSITSSLIQTEAITSNHLKVDQAMINKLMVNDLLANGLFARTAFINKLKAIDIDATRITTGLLRARNGNMTINMLTGETEYKGSASIRFYSSGNTLHYQNGTSRAFLNFNDAQRGGAAAVLGVNSGGNFRSDVPYFAGIKVFRNSETQAGGLLDQVDIVADTVTFSGGYNENNGVVMKCITDTPLRVLGKVQFRSWMDGNGEQYTGVGIVTKDTSNSSGAPIMYMDHRWSGDYLLYATAGAFRYVSTMEASDIRLKENINPTKITALDVIDDMRFVSFDWREKRKGSETLGLIAQELELLDTKLIKKVEDLEGNETYTLSELHLNLYALKGVQELINQNKQLSNRISYLESKIE